MNPITERSRPLRTGLARALMLAAVLSVVGCAGAGPNDVSFMDQLNNSFRFGVAQNKFADRRFVEAHTLSTEVVDREPQHRAALALLGWSAFMLGELDGAEQAFARVLDLDAEDFNGLLGSGWVQLKRGDLDAASEYFRRAEPNAEEWELHLIEDAIGWVALRRGNLDDAERHFKAEYALLYDPGQGADSWVGRGWVAIKRGNLRSARSHFERGLEVNSGCFFCHEGLAYVALLEGDVEEAQHWVVEGLRQVDYSPGLIFLLDGVLTLRRDPAENARVYAELKDLHPEVAAYHAGLGFALLQLGKPAEARGHLLQARVLAPDYAFAEKQVRAAENMLTALVADAWESYFKGDYEAALEQFDARREEAARAGNPAAEDGRGWALLSLGRVEEARKAFEEALRIAPGFTSSALGKSSLDAPYAHVYEQAWALADAEQLKAARSQFKRVRDLAPAHYQWRADDGLAWLKYYKGNYGAAEKAFRKVVDQYPEAYLSQRGLGLTSLRRGRYKAALQHLKTSFETEPSQRLVAYTVPAKQLLDKSRWQAAGEILDLGETAYPESADLLYLAARARLQAGDAAAAAEKLVAAADAAPEYIHPVFDRLKLRGASVAEAYRTMGWALYLQGDNEAALRRFEQYLRIHPDDREVAAARGYALYRLGRYKQARSQLEKVVKGGGADPVSESVLIPGGVGRWPIEYDARSTLAWTHYRLKQYEQAAKLFREVVRDHPDWVDAQSGLGYSQIALGDRTGAAESFHRAIVVQPAYPDAWQGLEMARKK